MKRPAGYDPVVAQEILDRVSNGEMLLKICVDEHLPTRNAFYGWMVAHPDLASSYARARLAWTDYWAERAIQISVNPERVIEADGKLFVDHAVVAWAKLLTDNIKWLCGKWGPRTYGDRPQDSETPAGALVIKWLDTSSEPPQPPQPPKQIEFKPPKIPGDLSERDWSLLMSILERVKARTPASSEKPPGEVLEAVAKAVDALYSPENVSECQVAEAQKT
jgi:hypothetical protein